MYKQITQITKKTQTTITVLKKQIFISQDISNSENLDESKQSRNFNSKQPQDDIMSDNFMNDKGNDIKIEKQNNVVQTVDRKLFQQNSIKALQKEQNNKQKFVQQEKRSFSKLDEMRMKQIEVNHLKLSLLHKIWDNPQNITQFSRVIPQLITFIGYPLDTAPQKETKKILNQEEKQEKEEKEENKDKKKERLITQIKKQYHDGASIKSLSEKYNRHWSTIKKYVNYQKK